AQAAGAHGIAGNRFFVGTLTFDDPTRCTCSPPAPALRPFRSRYRQVISWAAADVGATAIRLRKNVAVPPTLGKYSPDNVCHRLVWERVSPIGPKRRLAA